MSRIKKTVALLLALIIAIPFQACSNIFAVEFDSGGGSPVTKITKKSGELIADSPETTRTGYTFGGWYDKDGDQKISFPYTVKVNKEFLAKWTATAYTVTYNLNGGAFGSVTPQASYTIETDDITLAAPSRIGYTFAGWYDNQALGGTAVAKIVKGSTENKEFWAKWNTDAYTIKYNPNGGPAIADGNYTIESAAVTLPASGRTGYTFAGWHDNEGLTGDAVTEIPSGSTGNKTFWAKWDIKVYDIVYNPNGGTFGSAEPVLQYTIESGDVTLASPSRTGYTFAGWYDNAGLSGTAVTAVAAGSTEKKEFWANWNEIDYTLKYHLNGGTGAADRDYTVENTPFTLAVPDRAGYTFAGWYDNAGLTGTAVTEIPANSTGNKEFWAKWTLNDYTITYNLDGGAGVVSPGTFTIDDLPFTLPTPNKTGGYSFMGWFDNAGCTGTAVAQISTIGNKVYWAKWEEVTTEYKIDYNLNNGTLTPPYTSGFGAGDLPVMLPSPTRNGYTFGGWFENSGLTGTAVTQITTVGDKEYWAKWTANEYTITYLDQGGGAFNGTHGNGYPVKHTYGTATTLVDPSKTGYTFGGWFIASDCSGSRLLTLSGTGYTANITLHAKWTLNTYTATLNTNGGSLPSGAWSTGSRTFTISDLPLALPTPLDRSGYTFGGWFDNPGLTGTAVTQINAAGNIALYAKWTAINYTITYYLNGGTGVTSPGSFTVSNLPFTLPAPTRTGYRFLGWFDNSGLSGTAVTQITTIDHKEYWAKWSQLYTITYNLDGGSFGSVTPVTAFTAEDLNVVLPQPVKDGKSFGGWFGNAGLTGAVITQITETGNKTFWAKWEDITGDIVYTFEAEYVLLEWEDDEFETRQRPGSGYSGPGSGFMHLYRDIEKTMMISPTESLTKKANASNGYYITCMYMAGAFIDFEIYNAGSAVIENAELYARLTAEFYEMCIAPTDRTVGGKNYYSFLFEVINLGAVPFDPNGNPRDPRLNFDHPNYVSDKLDYTPIALKNITSQPGDCIEDFKDYLISSSVRLVPGWNVIRLRTNNAFKPIESGTVNSIAPMIDCIKISAAANLTMKKYEGNLDYANEG